MVTSSTHHKTWILYLFLILAVSVFLTSNIVEAQTDLYDEYNITRKGELNGSKPFQWWEFYGNEGMAFNVDVIRTSGVIVRGFG